MWLQTAIVDHPAMALCGVGNVWHGLVTMLPDCHLIDAVENVLLQTALRTLESSQINILTGTYDVFTSYLSQQVVS